MMWFRAAELKHGRAAMLGSVGYLIGAAGITFPGEIAKGVSFASVNSDGVYNAWAKVPEEGKLQGRGCVRSGRGRRLGHRWAGGDSQAMTGWALGELPATSSSAPSPARGGAIIDASGVWCFSAVWCALNPLHPRPSCPRLSHPPPLKSLTQLLVAGWPGPCLYLSL